MPGVRTATLLIAFILGLAALSGTGAAVRWSIPTNEMWNASTATSTKLNTSVDVYGYGAGATLAIQNITYSNQINTSTFMDGYNNGRCTLTNGYFYCNSFYAAVYEGTRPVVSANVDYVNVATVGYGEYNAYYGDCRQYLANFKLGDTVVGSGWRPFSACVHNSERCEGDCYSGSGLTSIGVSGQFPQAAGKRQLNISFTNTYERAGCYGYTGSTCTSGYTCYSFSVSNQGSYGCGAQPWVQIQADYTVGAPYNIDPNYTVIKDLGRNVDLMNLTVNTFFNSGASAEADITVNDDNATFDGKPSMHFDLQNGNNNFDISGLPTKRYVKIVVTLRPAAGTMNTPVINSLGLEYIDDTQPPVTVVNTTMVPDSGLKYTQDVKFNATCIDPAGTGCNQTYYLLTAANECPPTEVGYWSFETASGTTIKELFNGLDAVLYGNAAKGACSNGITGSCLVLNGQSGYAIVMDNASVGIPNNPLLNGFGGSETEFSVETWVNPNKCVDESNPSNPTDVYIVSKWGSDNKGDYMVRLSQDPNSPTSCKVQFRVASNNSGFVQDYINATNSIPVNTWSFIAATFDTGTMKLYINGQLENSKTSSLMTNTQRGVYPNDDLYFGSYYDNTHNLNGYIDDIRVYDKVLSARAITEHYNMREFWQTARNVGTELKLCGPEDGCKYFVESTATCPTGQICTRFACAYSKDSSSNVEDCGAPKQNYTIDKENIQCTISAPARTASPFNVSVTASTGALKVDIDNSTDGTVWTNATGVCTKINGTYPGSWWASCTLPNGTALLKCNATGQSLSYVYSTPVTVNVDSIAPTCAINTMTAGSIVNASWNCTDPGSGMSSMEAQANLTSFIALATLMGCNVTQSACSGTLCMGSATCNATLLGKTFRVRGNDAVGNVAAWANSACVDADGDGYCAGSSQDCNDTNANIKPGATELCDGVDNNCDGAVDETWRAAPYNLTQACGTFGACKGVYVCNADGNGTVCNGSAPTQEICSDGLDNDCDNSTDELTHTTNNVTTVGCICKSGTSRTCGNNLGICKTGTQSCVNGNWTDCINQTLPMAYEICINKADDDCDGTTDEADCRICSDSDTKACGSNVGACSQGVQTCSSGVWNECTGNKAPVKEICNDGIDNDCDDDTDSDDSDCLAINTTCNDGKKDGDEEGIDCGGSCPEQCDTCKNHIKDEGEQGIDCGGVCDKECEPNLQVWVIVSVVAIVAVIVMGLVVVLSRGRGAVGPTSANAPPMV